MVRMGGTLPINRNPQLAENGPLDLGMPGSAASTPQRIVTLDAPPPPPLVIVSSTNWQEING